MILLSATEDESIPAEIDDPEAAPEEDRFNHLDAENNPASATADGTDLVQD